MLRPTRLWWLNCRGGLCHDGVFVRLDRRPPVPELDGMIYIEYCPPTGPCECQTAHDARRDMTPTECDAAMRYVVGVATEARDAAEGERTLCIVIETRTP